MNTQHNPYALGFSVFGPLFLGMACFTARRAKERGYQRLYFASRDGYYLKAAYDVLRHHVQDLPEAHYFVSSRRLANICSIGDASDIARIAAIDFHPCAAGRLLAARFGLTDNDLQSIPASVLHAVGLRSVDEVVDQAGGRDKVVALAQAVGPLIAERAAIQRDVYREYLRSMNMDGPDAAIVDIGYSGTIQVALADLLDHEVGGLYFITWERAAQLDQRGLAFDSFLGHKVGPEHRFNKYIQLFELVFSATHPSVIGVTQGQAGNYEFAYGKNIFDNPELAVLAEMHRGAIDFVSEFASGAPFDFIGSQELSAEQFCAPAFRFFAEPQPWAAALLCGVFFEDDYGGTTSPLIFKVDGGRAMSAVTAEELSIWREGCRALADLPYGVGASFRSEVVYNHYVHAGRRYFNVDRFDGDKLLPAYVHALPSALPVAVAPSARVRWLLIVRVGPEELVHLDGFMCALAGQFYTPWIVLLIDDAGTARAPHHELVKWRTAPMLTFDVVIETAESAAAKLGGLLNEATAVLLGACASRLKPDALAELTLAMVERQADMVYTDHESAVAHEGGDALVFKPSWSPELLLSENYIGSVFALSSAITAELLRLYGMQVLLDSYRCLLKVGKMTRQIVHLPRVLWESNETRGDAETAQAALREAWKEQGIECELKVLVLPNGKITYRPVFAQDGPAVAIIIPTKNALEILEVCVRSLELTQYRQFRVYIIDNGSDDPATLRYLAQSEHQVLRIPSPGGQFNYSYINNQAVEMVDEPYVLFLNNDTEVINPDWLGQMMGWMRISGVGAVGARLLFQNGKIQHAGLLNALASASLPVPAFKLIERDDPGYLGHAMMARNYSALTAACLLTPRALFREFGGFDETEFGVAYNDCDYGFRLTRAGYRNVYCPDAELYHYEGFTRGIGIGNDKPSEEAACVSRYGAWADPYYNPNLELNCTDFRIAARTAMLRPPESFKTLFVSHNLNFEGAPGVLCDIACGLHASGVTRAAVLSPRDGPLRARYEAAGVEVVILDQFPFFAAKDPVTYHRAIHTVKHTVLSLGVSLVFANTVLAWWAIDIAKNLDLPSVWCIHESETPFAHFDEHGKFLKSCARRCLSYPYQVIFVAYATQKLYAPLIERHNTTVVHNGFDPQRLDAQVHNLERSSIRATLGVADDELMVLTVGTVCDRKNQKELLEALLLLAPEIQAKLRVYIVGDRESPYSRELHHIVAGLPPMLAGRVYLVKESGAVGPYYRAADVFTLTSRLESFPVVIQEAMHFGLPMVVQPSFGIREQVVNEKSALFYSASDSRELSEQLTRLLSQPDLRENLGRNAHVTLGRLPTVPAMLARYAGVIGEAWQSARSR